MSLITCHWASFILYNGKLMHLCVWIRTIDHCNGPCLESVRLREKCVRVCEFVCTGVESQIELRKQR